jgi:stress response protein YsnF
LYEMNEQNHQQLRKYEERLIANRKQRNSGRAL